MKKAFLIIMISGVLLLAVGGGVFAFGMSKISWDFGALSNTDYFQESASFSAEDVQSVVLELSTQDVSFLASDNDEITVEYFIVKNKKGDVLREAVPTLSNGVLTCKEEGTGVSFFNFDFGRKEKVVVKIPSEKTTAVSLKISTGKVIFGENDKERKVSSLKIEASTGNLTFLGKTTCENDLSLAVSTGEIEIKGEIVCGGDFRAKASTGKISFPKPLSANRIFLETSTGDVKCAAPLSFNGFEAIASTGDITLLAAGKKEDYTFLYETNTGKSNLSPFASGAKTILIRTSPGDITLSFIE